MRPEEEEVVILEDLDTTDLINDEQKNAKYLCCPRCDSKILPPNTGAFQNDTEKSLHVMHKKQEDAGKIIFKIFGYRWH